MTQIDLFSSLPPFTGTHAPHLTGAASVMLHCREEFRYDWHDFGGPIDAVLTIPSGSMEAYLNDEGEVRAFDFNFRPGWCK